MAIKCTKVNNARAELFTLRIKMASGTLTQNSSVEQENPKNPQIKKLKKASNLEWTILFSKYYGKMYSGHLFQYGELW